MAAPLDGIRVLEVANWLAAPAATALMADMGADVIKVEPPGGDIFRQFQLRSLGYEYDFPTNYGFQTDNRGKRSITVALDRPGGPQVREMGWIAELQHPEHGSFQVLDTPFHIYGSDTGARGPAPEPGQHTFDLLAEFGIDGERLNELATNGVLG